MDKLEGDVPLNLNQIMDIEHPQIRNELNKERETALRNELVLPVGAIETLHSRVSNTGIFTVSSQYKSVLVEQALGLQKEMSQHWAVLIDDAKTMRDSEHIARLQEFRDEAYDTLCAKVGHLPHVISVLDSTKSKGYRDTKIEKQAAEGEIEELGNGLIHLIKGHSRKERNLFKRVEQIASQMSASENRQDETGLSPFGIARAFMEKLGNYDTLYFDKGGNLVASRTTSVLTGDDFRNLNRLLSDHDIEKVTGLIQDEFTASKPDFGEGLDYQGELDKLSEKYANKLQVAYYQDMIHAFYRTHHLLPEFLAEKKNFEDFSADYHRFITEPRAQGARGEQVEVDLEALRQRAMYWVETFVPVDERVGLFDRREIINGLRVRGFELATPGLTNYEVSTYIEDNLPEGAEIGDIAEVVYVDFQNTEEVKDTQTGSKSLRLTYANWDPQSRMIKVFNPGIDPLEANTIMENNSWYYYELFMERRMRHAIRHELGHVWETVMFERYPSLRSELTELTDSEENGLQFFSDELGLSDYNRSVLRNKKNIFRGNCR